MVGTCTTPYITPDPGIIYNTPNGTYKLCNWNIKYNDITNGAIIYNPSVTIVAKYATQVINSIENNIWYQTGASTAATTSWGYYPTTSGPLYQHVNIQCGNGVTVGADWAICSHAWGDCPPPKPLPVSERMRQIIQSRMAPKIIIPSRKPVKTEAEEREVRARETLCNILGPDRFQRFLRNGFVSVQAPSGKVYQIYPGHGQTVVYNKGKPIEKMCVVFRGDFCPTDSLITRMLMIMHDEAGFRKKANVSSHYNSEPQRLNTVDARPLSQIIQELKAAA